MKRDFYNLTSDKAMLILETDGDQLVVGYVFPRSKATLTCPENVDIYAQELTGLHANTSIGSASGLYNDIVVLREYTLGGTTYTTRDVLQGHSELQSTYEVPVIGTVTVPEWAEYSPEMTCFFLGFAFATGIRLFRAALRWFKRADGVEGVSGD